MKTLLFTMFCAIHVSSLSCMEMSIEAQSVAAAAKEAQELAWQQAQIKIWQEALNKIAADLEANKRKPEATKEEIQSIAQALLLYSCYLQDHVHGRIALDHGALINFRYKEEIDQTPLMLACRFFKKDAEKLKHGDKLLRMLLEEPGLDINVCDEDGCCALTKCCVNDQTAVPLKILLEYKDNLSPALDLNVLRTSKYSALHVACQLGNVEHVRILCNQPEVNPNIQGTPFKRTPLYNHLLQRPPSEAVLITRLLANKGASFECKDHESSTVLDAALSKNNPWNHRHECLLRALGANLTRAHLELLSPGSSPTLGYNIHTLAASYNIHTLAANTLIKFCYKWAIKGETAALDEVMDINDFLKAPPKEYPSIKTRISKILEACIKESDLNIKDAISFTPFMWAAACGRMSLAEALYEFKQLDVNMQDNFGDTALHHAARNGHAEMVEFLLRLPETDTSIKNSTGLTAYKVAKNCMKWAPIEYKHEKVIAVFRELYEERARLVVRIHRDTEIDDEFFGTRTFPIEITEMFAQGLRLRGDGKERLFIKKSPQSKIPMPETQTPLS